MINEPPLASNLPAGDALAVWTPAWSNWFSQAWAILVSEQQFGTTAQRPTRGLWIGRRFFDTDLGARGKPIFVSKDGATWVLADGTAA